MSTDKKGKMDLTLIMNYAGNIIFQQDGKKLVMVLFIIMEKK